MPFEYSTLLGAVGEFHVQLRYWVGVGADGFSNGHGGMSLGQNTMTLSPTEEDWLSHCLTALPNSDCAATHVDVRFIVNAFAPFNGTALADNFILSKNAAGDFDEDSNVDGNDFLE